MHSRSTSSSSSPSYHESKSHASFGKRTVSIRIYVSTVAFLGCIMVWMQLANTNFDVNNNNNNNGGGGGGGGFNVVDNPTIRSIYYGQSVKRKTSSSSTIINDDDDDEDLIALRILVWDQGKILKEQEKQLSILQKRFDDTPQSSSSSSSSSSSLSENDEKKTTKTQVQQTLVRSLGGGKTGSTSLIVSLTDRLSRLETMTKGYMNWITDPFTGSRAIYKCKNEKDISEHYVCFDDFPPTHTPLSSSSSSSSKEEEVVVIVSSSPDSNSSSTKSKNKKCVVYDYGIREQPQFGLYFAKNYPQCEVHAFDPSPISVKWWNTDTNDVVLKELKALPNYFFHDWGAGGVDGTIQLFGYNWGQVSSVRVPFFTSSLCGYGNDKFNRYNESFISDPKNYHLIQCLSSTDIKYRYSAPTHDFSYFDEETQKHDDFDETHLLNVKTLKTTMEELGHTHIDVLKMDVEGSEYQFLESAIDEYDCPPVSQMSIEWHHYSFDPRYGGGSSREMNSIVTYLHDRCNVKTYQGEEEGGYCINKAFAKDSGLRMCYMTTSLMTVPPS
jgi:hypothetical protein